MIFDKNGNTTIITQEKASIPELVKNLRDKHNSFSNDNVIINLTSLGALNNNDISEFLQLAKLHKESNKSFVIVSNKIDINSVSDEIAVVPTLQEASDFIDMEEMERDLGI
ncbi:MAG: ribonuclease Z [Bacteroidetes bacterium MedPE-SWsnd-G2]|nr:MAG: ribonuclease Z [Bacteroidetes bacterium MedPE-SWsnd-G2]